MGKRDDNSFGDKLKLGVYTPFFVGDFFGKYSDNRESWLVYDKNLTFSLLR